MLELHPPLPRSQSLKSRISDACWAQGVNAFYIDGVPFSSGCSFETVESIAQFIVAVSPKTGPVSWAELGSGMGIFSQRLLDYLSENYADFYTRFTLGVTDGESAIVNKIAGSELVSAHRDHHYFSRLNVTTPLFPISPFGIYCSYLFDSLPTAHIHVVKGRPFVVHIRSLVEDKIVMVQRNVFPSPLLSGSHLVAAFQASPISVPSGRYIAPLIQEEFIDFPLEMSELSESDRHLLYEFVRVNQIESGYFNIPLELEATLSHFYTQLDPEGGVLIRDFTYEGNTLVPEPRYLTVSYGGTLFFPIYPDYFDYVSRKVGFSFFGPNTAQTQPTQFCFLTKSTGSIPDKPTLDELCSVENDATTQAEHALSKISSDATVTDLDEFPRSVQEDLAFLSAFTNELLLRNLPEVCVSVGLKLPDLYRELASPCLYNLGRAYFLLGDLERAEVYFRQALSDCDLFFPALSDLGLLLVQKNRYEAAFHTLISYLMLATKPAWSTYITLALLAIQLGRKPFSSQVVNWLEDASASHPGLIPQSVLDQAKTIQIQFLKREASH